MRTLTAFAVTIAVLFAPAPVDAKKNPKVKPPKNPPATQIVCHGDGHDGKRVQAVYVRTADQPDGYAQAAADIRKFRAGEVEGIFARSAAQTGGVRHVRWVTNDCVLDVANVVLPAGTGTDFGSMVDVFPTKDSTRIYLMWTEFADYCGIGWTWNDDRPDPTVNANAVNVGYARVDRWCWDQNGGAREAHELAHALGAAQLSAPHSNGNYHVTDNYDLLGDGQYDRPCAKAQEFLLDCGHDDYFSTNPAPGSYLATHWNIANHPALSP